MINKKCFAIDFDGTLVVDAYPDIGIPNWEIINKVKQLISDGHEFILWTCRTGEYLQQAVSYCEETLGIKFDRINESSISNLVKYDAESRKIGADYYVDDKCISLNEFINLDLR